MNLDGIIRQPSWYKNAGCLNYDPDWWFYGEFRSKQDFEYDVDKVRVALSICDSCPVKNECLKTGMEKKNMITGSIWGGLLYSERLFLKGKVPKRKRAIEAVFRKRVRAKIAKAS
jgi:hypothetical protein